MIEHGHGGADFVEVLEVQFGQDVTDSIGCAGNPVTPGIVDCRLPQGGASIVVVSPLIRSKHVGLGFNGSSLQQRMPVRPAGLQGEGGGDGDYLGTGCTQSLVEAREPEIIANAQPYLNRTSRPTGHFRDHKFIAGVYAGGLLKSDGIIDVDIEEMNLSIGGHDLSLWRDMDLRIKGSQRIGGLLSEAPDGKPDFVGSGQLAKLTDLGPVERLSIRKLFAVLTEKGGVFRKKHPFSAGL